MFAEVDTVHASQIIEQNTKNQPKQVKVNKPQGSNAILKSPVLWIVNKVLLI